MNELQDLKQFDRPVRTVQTDDGVRHVVDLGPGTSGAVDVVGDTVLVVLADEQYELSVTEGDAQAFIRNGVLTIDVEDSA